MSYEPLHHKYRPQTFADLVGQEMISLTLTNAIESNKIAPAYLFSGPRGTGKTSSARILAKSLNCLASHQPTANPCGRCEVCQAIAAGNALDVMEIDAASNTGVDNIREIIERSRFAPVQCRYKIYAIDECHMLSTAAFNALLKTLEEPPPQVVFILATTDPQRVLSTIISRCQRFDYRRIPLEGIIAHLKSISSQEGIKIVDEAIRLVAQIANGGLRDAESLLDQLSLLPNTITVSTVWDLIGAVPEKDLLELLVAIKNDRHETVIQQCRHLLNRGLEPLTVLQNLAGFYLNLLIAKTAPSRPDLVGVTELCWQELCRVAKDCSLDWILKRQQQLQAAETQLKDTTQPRLWLEITLLSLLPGANSSSAKQLEAQIVQSPAIPQQPTLNALSSKREFKQASIPQEITVNIHEREIVAIDSPQDRDALVTSASLATAINEPDLDREAIWQQVIACLHPPTTQALLSQQCHLISIEATQATVGISSAKLRGLHQGKLPNIEAAFEKVCQRKINVKLEVSSKQAVPTTAVSKTDASNYTCDFLRSSIDRKFLQEHNTESESSEKLEPTKVPQINLAINLSQNEVMSSELSNYQKNDLDNDTSRECLQQAVENLAKNFDGEIVQVQLEQKIKRDFEINTFEDNEIPFIRPVYSRTNFGKELCDSWELEANQY